MKSLNIYLFIVVFGLNYAFGQTTDKIPVPILKENKRIDSLLDRIFAQRNLAKKGIIKLKDSCWRIEIRNFTDYISFQIVENKKSAVNVLVNKLTSYRNRYGYFNHKGYKIFVWTEDDFHGFFEKTPNTAEFSFIYDLVGDKPYPPDESMYSNIFHYKYEGGSFSVEGPPRMKY